MDNFGYAQQAYNPEFQMFEIFMKFAKKALGGPILLILVPNTSKWAHSSEHPEYSTHMSQTDQLL